MTEDYFTHTEVDAGLYERQRAMDEYDDDRPSLSDLVDCECPPPNYEYEPHYDCPKHGWPTSPDDAP